MNPFTYARMTITTPRRIAEVHAVVDRLRAEGFQDGARQYRVRGSRHGDRFALSLGWPVLGGAEPVLFGRIRSGAQGSEVDLTLGSRLTMRVGLALAALLLVIGGASQIGLQCMRVRAGQASPAAITEVLPGIVIMGVLIVLADLALRARARPRARQWFGVLADALDVPPRNPDDADPIHSNPSPRGSHHGS